MTTREAAVDKSYEDVRAHLQEALPTLAPAQALMAKIVLDQPHKVAFESATSLAQHLGVHPSTVVRFAAVIGLPNHRALVALCRHHLTHEPRAVTRLGQNAELAESDNLLDVTAELEVENLRQTLARIDPEAWSQACAWLAGSDQVHVLGLRKCQPVAQLFAYLLRMIRPGVRHLQPTTGMLADDLRDVGPSDTFVAISIRRYTSATTEAMAVAKERGAHTLAITDASSSPLARHAGIALLFDSGGVTLFRSVAAAIVLCQALATEVAHLDGKRSRKELLNDEDLLNLFHTYLEE